MHTVACLGGARNPGIEAATNEQLSHLALAALARHMGLTAQPDCIVAGVHKACIPQYTVGHASRVSSARAALGSLFDSRLRVAGNSYDGIGASDCVNSGMQAAQAVLSAVK